MSRPKVLMLSRNLPPLRGGMERLNHHIAEELAREFELSVCGPNGCTGHLPFAHEVLEAPLRPLSKFLLTTVRNAGSLASRQRPQLLFCGSGLVVPIALIVAIFVRARVVAYLHGLDIISDHPVYRYFWRPLLRRVDAAIVNSRNTRQLAMDAGVPEARLHVLHPGVELPSAGAADAAEFRRRFALGERPLLISLGRLTARKGLAEFVERTMPEVVRARPEAMLVVIGDEATDALNGDGVGQKQRIIDAAARAGVESALCMLGPQPDETVSGALLAGSVLIFPVLDLPGDVEGFGMVAVEAAAHGLPTVAFAVGGVPDAISEPDTGRLLPPGDYPGLARAAIDYLPSLPTEPGSGASMALRLQRCAHAARYAWPLFGERLRGICLQTLGEP